MNTTAYEPRWRRNTGMTAAEALVDLVRELTRARARQIWIECGWAGLFFGLAAAVATMLAIRLEIVDLAPRFGVGAVLAAAALIVVVVALYRRPDPLAVAIRTDLDAGLKERLSTAWEFARAGAEPRLVERLASQAVEMRGRLSPNRLFPNRVSLLGKLSPVAAAMLFLVATADFSRVVAPVAPPALDAALVDEGQRLREYGRRMEGRARRDGLSRSLSAAERVQAAGRRMESAALTREEALGRLRELAAEIDDSRRAALDTARQIDTGLEIQELGASGAGRIQSLRALLRQLLERGVSSGDDQGLGGAPGELAGLGISASELEKAIEELAGGDERALEDILDKLSALERTARDAQELADAQAAVDRARANLGDARSAEDVAPSQPGAPVSPEAGLGGARPDRASQHEGAGADDGGDGGTGSYSPEGSDFRRQQSSRRSGEQRGTIVKPKGQLREGAVYRAEARALPRQNEAEVARVNVNRRFEAQLEQVLSKEEYPLHYKEFIRRYFLSLSDGGPGGEAETEQGQR